MRKEFLARIEKALNRFENKIIADIPSGDGSWWKGLAITRNNYVLLLDISPPEPTANILSVCSNADTVLPLRSNSIDAFISIEGIEHLLSPHHFAGEIYRVLKPGGLLILTTPNISSLSSRIQFLLRGKYAGCTPITKSPDDFGNFDDYEEFRFKEHSSPMSLAQLLFVLSRSGFKIIETQGIVIKLSHFALLPFCWLLQFITYTGLKKRLSPDQARLRRTMNRQDMLLGKHIFIYATKDDPVNTKRNQHLKENF